MLRTKFYKRMRLQYIAFIFLTSLLDLALWYYSIVFCAVYQTTAIAWLLASLFSVIFSWFIFQMMSPVFIILIRKFTDGIVGLG
jgi:hypothetical protein